MKNKILIILIIFCIAFSFSISQEKEKKSKIVSLKTSYFKYNNKTKDLFTDKGVILTTEDIIIKAKEILYNTDTEIANLKGDLEFKQTGTEITGEEAIIYLKEKKIILEKNIKMVQEKKEIKRETGLKEHLKEYIFLFGNKVEYDYEKKEGRMTGNVKVEQEDGFASGDSAEYYDKEEIIIVSGNVKLDKKDGDKLKCNKATIYLKDDTLEVEGNVEGKFKVEEEKIPETKF